MINYNMFRKFIFNCLPFGIVSLLVKNYCSDQLTVLRYDGTKEYWQATEISDGYYITYSQRVADIRHEQEKKRKATKSEKITRKLMRMFHKSQYDITLEDNKDLARVISEHIPIETLKSIIADKYNQF